MLRANPALSRAFERHAKQLLAKLRQTDGVAGRVREQVAAQLGTGTVTMRATASGLAMSVATLRRRLEEEGDALPAAPLRLVVIDNGGGGIFDFLPQAEQVETDRFERLFTTPSALDFERVAALFEHPLPARSTLGDLAELAERERVLAHVRVARGDNVDLHARIAEAVAGSCQLRRATERTGGPAAERLGLGPMSARRRRQRRGLSRRAAAAAPRA